MISTGIKLFVIGSAFIIMGCDSSNNQTERTINKETVKSDIKDVNAEEFKSLITENSILLDVRTKSEFQSGHIDGAVNIDFFSETFTEEVMKLDKNKIILIYCASGGRSGKTMNKLKNAGYVSLRNLIGGIGAWKKMGYEIIK